VATTLADETGRAYFRDKATMRTHREIDGNIGAAGLMVSGAYDPVCGAPASTRIAGTVGSTESRFYRFMEAP
jgi:hypothetical protein